MIKGSGSALKVELDTKVAMLLGMPRKQVSAITYEFIEAVRDVLIEEGVVAIPRLGAIKIFKSAVDRELKLKTPNRVSGKAHKVYVKRNIKVSFSKSPQLKRDLENKHGKARRR